MKILFVQTGGTIDKDYPKTTNGWGFEIGAPAFDRLLSERLAPSFAYETLTVCRKDSTEITDRDRSDLRARIEARLRGEAVFVAAVTEPHPTQHRHPSTTTPEAFGGVIVTHGTDTMAETARFLANGPPLGVPVVLTGAMRPERFCNSDADCHLGMAMAAVQTVPPGFVGICMHGLVLKHDAIGRDPATGRFVRAVGGSGGGAWGT